MHIIIELCILTAIAACCAVSCIVAIEFVISYSEYVKPSDVIKSRYAKIFKNTTWFGKITGVLYVIITIPSILITYVIYYIEKLIRWLSSMRYLK